MSVKRELFHFKTCCKTILSLKHSQQLGNRPKLVLLISESSFKNVIFMDKRIPKNPNLWIERKSYFKVFSKMLAYKEKITSLFF
jgi:hypothetical protein